MSRLRVLAITRIFPNAVEPLAAPFNRQQFAELGKLCDLHVMATIPWFPGAALTTKSKSGSRRKVPRRDTIAGLDVSHPRVAYVPRLAGLSGALEVASLLPSFLPRRRDIDVILGSWAYPEGAASVALAAIAGVPAVIKVHGSDLNVQSTMFGPRTNLSFALPKADALVAVSAALGEKAISLGMARDRVHIVANGTDSALFRVRDRDEARAELTWPSDSGGSGAWPKRLILYCGRIERAKGVMDLLEGFERIAGRAPDLSLALLGDGGAMAEAKAKAAPLGDRVAFLGGRPLPEVPKWMSASTLVTLPSHAEGSPNVIREALACGRPVVGTNVGGIPELLGSDGALGAMVPAKDPAALGEALLEIASRNFEPAAIAARSGGSWQDSAAALFAVLKSAVDQRSARK